MTPINYHEARTVRAARGETRTMFAGRVETVAAAMLAKAHGAFAGSHPRVVVRFSPDYDKAEIDCEVVVA